MLRLFTEILESSLELDQCCTQHCIIYCRAMQCISAAYVVMRCLSVSVSVCVSVTFVSCVKTNKDIFEIFSPSGNHTILVFPYQTGWQYSDATRTPVTGASNANAGGV